MYIYIYIHIYLYICIYIPVQSSNMCLLMRCIEERRVILLDIYTYTHTYINTHTYIYVYIYINICIYQYKAAIYFCSFGASRSEGSYRSIQLKGSGDRSITITKMQPRKYATKTIKKIERNTFRIVLRATEASCSHIPSNNNTSVSS